MCEYEESIALLGDIRDRKTGAFVSPKNLYTFPCARDILKTGRKCTFLPRKSANLTPFSV